VINAFPSHYQSVGWRVSLRAERPSRHGVRLPCSSILPRTIRVSELTDRIEEYRDEYGTDSPAGVDVLEFDAEETDDIHVDLGDWATAIEERRLHERARRKAAGPPAPSHS